MCISYKFYAEISVDRLIADVQCFSVMRRSSFNIEM